MRFTRVLPAAIATAALLTVTAGSTPAWAGQLEPTVVKASMFSASWCPFGRHEGGGCRGGSINDNAAERAKRAAVDTLQMYKDAIECTTVIGEGAIDLVNDAGGNPARNLRECSQERGYWR